MYVYVCVSIYVDICVCVRIDVYVNPLYMEIIYDKYYINEHIYIYIY